MRDRDIRQAIKDILDATLVFDPQAVWLWGLPEIFGSVRPFIAGCAIDPHTWTENDVWDAGDDADTIVKTEIKLTFLYRHDDPILRDEGCEQLLNTARNVLTGQSLAGLTMPEQTRFTHGQWLPPAIPERRIVAFFDYWYLAPGVNGFDTSI